MAGVVGLAYLAVLGATSALAALVHPGVLVSGDQLLFVSEAVGAGAQPAAAFLAKAAASPYGQKNYTIQGPPKGGNIDCGSYSKPNNGCSAEDEDAASAFTLALMFHLTNDTAYGEMAIRILNAYGHNLKKYTNANAPLQAAWGASKWARAAELMKHSNANWTSSDQAAFAKMLTSISLPLIKDGSTANGNWELSMIEGTIGIAVFTDDEDLFNHAVAMWRARVPSYFWNLADGPQPIPAPRGDPSWYGMVTFNASSNGVAQETCRDFGHTSYGIAASFNTAETALIQGVDLYSEGAGPGQVPFSQRLAATLEFHSKYLLKSPAPRWLCGGAPTLEYMPTMEIGYTALAHRLGTALPNTLAHITTDVRTAGSNVDAHMMVYETLTHGSGCVGCKNE